MITARAMTKLVSPTGKPLTLASVRANVGVEVRYRRLIMAYVDAMHADIVRTIERAYVSSGAQEMAHDATPANELREAMRKMGDKWLKRFDVGSKELAAWFAQQARDRSDTALDAILRKAGFTVRFHMSHNMQNAYDAVIGEQVGLIRSIASRHLTQVETLVMQAVQAGRKLDVLAKLLHEQYDVTKRRAALIARDQNNKATGTLNRQRRLDLGMTQAKWRHSGAGRHPRPEHVKADGDIYEITKGMYLDGSWTWPGYEINCRCFDNPVIPGF
jgi:uncharacterized protein with gpF-like domain